MPPRSQRHRLQDVLDCIDRIRSHTRGDLRAGLDDGVVRDAVLYNLMIVGEAVKHIEAEMKDLAEGVNWSGAAGLRDVLMHRYYRTDIEIVKSLDDELSRLRSGVESVLRHIGPD